ncbi:hypothetical protein ACFQ07_10470, partial [Actinomadura adrarensis]
LPLAADQAAAYLVETEETVAEYLEKFQRASAAIAPTDTDFHYPHAAAVSCTLSQNALSAPALALLRVLASISPEPVSGEILVQPDLLDELPEEVREALSGTRPFRRAVRELARFSLVQFNLVRNETQIHRIVKAIVEDGMRQHGFGTPELYRRAVHMLLAGTDPRNPEQAANDTTYERTRPHLIPSGAVTSDHPPARDLVINQVR